MISQADFSESVLSSTIEINIQEEIVRNGKMIFYPAPSSP
jgi:hypothetical protein